MHLIYYLYRKVTVDIKKKSKVVSYIIHKGQRDETSFSETAH